LEKALQTLPFLSETQLIKLKNWFSFIHNLRKRFIKTKVKNYFNQLYDYRYIIKEIDSNIDDNCQVRDHASEELYGIRVKKKRLKQKLRDKLNDLLMKRSNLFTDSHIVERSGRYVLPVKRNFKNDVRGIVYSYSNSGETVFIEPMEITEDTAKLVELNETERREIERILKKLTGIVNTQVDAIENDIETIIDLDLLFAKVQYAHGLHATMPLFGENLNIVNGYHPILKRVEENAVPLNLKMNPQHRILLISGPNAGGKTVVLKTVGLIIEMAKCGMFIPVEEGSTIPFFQELYADIGDEQSIESHLSTFAAHVKQIRNALDGGSNSLILLDELMNQTSVEEGSALAIAILEEFAQKRSTILATTHNENLKIFVSRRADMINAGMEFTDRPTYRLILGIPQPSNAIKLARKLGLNGNVIKNAVKFLDKDTMSLNKLFEDLSKELKGVKEERQRLSGLISEYETKLKTLNIKKKTELDELKKKYKTDLIQTKRKVEKLIKNLKKEGPKPDAIHKMRGFFDEKLKVDEIREPYIPRVGEMVRIRDFNRFGQVVEEQGGKFKVSLENIYYWVEPKDIEPA
jgi:DNA mismatch repair protein MutS2